MKRVVVCALIGIGIAACQTRGPAPEPKPQPRVQRQFVPLRSVSMLSHGEGRYPDLFSAQSYAVWVDADLMRVKHDKAVRDGENPDLDLASDAAAITNDFIVIECHVASEFSDQSIAYDAVRYRGISIYLQTPGGRRIPPIQTQSVGSVEEQQRGALKLFGRTHVAMFQREDLWVGGPVLKQSEHAVRLVLEGHGNEFYFDWPGGLSEEVRKRTLSATDYSRAVQLGFTDLYTSIRRLANIFS